MWSSFDVGSGLRGDAARSPNFPKLGAKKTNTRNPETNQQKLSLAAAVLVPGEVMPPDIENRPTCNRKGLGSTGALRVRAWGLVRISAVGQGVEG